MPNLTDDRLYFAYGSNLNIAQMHQRCSHAMAIRRLRINGWKLVFRDVADIEPCTGAVVDGALYRVTASDVAALDRYEGVKSGLYRQVTFRIRDTNELAFFYVMNDCYVFPPSPDYYETIAKGYADWQLPLRTLDAALTEAYATVEAEDAAAVKDDYVFFDDDHFHAGYYDRVT